MMQRVINANVFISIFLVVLGVVHLALLLLLLRFDVLTAVIDTVTTYGSLGILVSLGRMIAQKLLPKYSQIFVIIFQSLILSIIWIVSFDWMVEYYFAGKEYYLNFWNSTVFIRGIIAWILLCNFSMVHFLASSQSRVLEEKEDRLYHEQLRREAELYKLQQQINPHFLFNTLNSINALIGISSEKARIMIQQLSQYFRNSIKKDVPMIALKDELEDIKLYFEIEKVRFGHRLSLHEEIEDKIDYIMIPPFIIQPLVENAIKYGLYGTLGVIKISLKISLEDERRLIGTPHLLIQIENPFDVTVKQSKGTGFGLTYVRRRLFLLYGREDLLRCSVTPINTDHDENTDQKNFLAQLIIPIKE